MKKWISLLLVTVLCLSLAACGDSKPQDNSGTAQGQTADNCTQNTGEPSGADVPQNTGEPSDAEPTEQTVEITLDNWQDYFEIKQYLSGYIGTNAFGHGCVLWPCCLWKQYFYDIQYNYDTCNGRSCCTC